MNKKRIYVYKNEPSYYGLGGLFSSLHVHAWGIGCTRHFVGVSTGPIINSIHTRHDAIFGS